MTRDASPKRNLMPDRLVAERYSVGVKTIERWGKDPKMAFPPIVMINKRRYRSVAALDAWDRKVIHRATNTDEAEVAEAAA